MGTSQPQYTWQYNAMGHITITRLFDSKTCYLQFDFETDPFNKEVERAEDKLGRGFGFDRVMNEYCAGYEYDND